MTKIDQKKSKESAEGEVASVKKQAQNWRYLSLLERSGLSEKEAAIFEALLEEGELGAGDIIRLVNLKRGDTYNHIYSLKQKGLIEETTQNGRKRFRLEHPSKIEIYLENRSRELSEATKEVQAVMPGILSTYNLSYHKPGVKVFEGDEAVKTVLEDTLRAKSEILAFIDAESVIRYIPNINTWYGKERNRLKKKKLNLVFDSKFNREYFAKHSYTFTQNRLIDYDANLLGVSLHIYDNTISFMTLKPTSKMGVIIDDPLMANMIRALFRAMWEKAKPVS